MEKRLRLGAGLRRRVSLACNSAFGPH